MTDLLGIGAAGIATYRTALAVTGDNVANAETPGYARRTTTIRQAGAVGGANPLYRSSLMPGGGSVATGVQRAWDQFKASDARDAMGDHGRASTTATWLDAAESAVDASDTGVGAKVSAVFTAASQLAADPSSVTARAQMLGAIGDAADAMSDAAGRIGKVAGGIADNATAAVNGVNDDLSALAKLNALMTATPDGSEAKATLADQRDQMLDDLAGKVGIDATVASDGSVSVKLSGGGGATLLAGTDFNQVGMNIGGDGRLAFSVNDVAVAPSGGALAGLASAANGVAGSRAGLDDIATSFASQINAWNAAGRTPAGTAGQALLATTGGAAGLALVATSGAAIAAAGTDGTANGNLLSLQDLRGSDGAEARLAGLVGTNAQALASAKAQAAASDTRLTAATVARDDASGVSLDQEAAELVRFQQAYDGSAKVIQAAQTTLQAILALF